MKYFSTRQSIIIVFTISILFTGYFVLKTYNNMLQAENESEKMTSILNLIEPIQKIEQDLQELETSLYWYMFLAKDSLEIHHKKSFAKFINDELLLKRQPVTDATNIRLKTALEHLMAKKIEAVNSANRLYKASGKDAVIKKFNAVEEKKPGDEIRKFISDFHSNNQSILKQSSTNLKVKAQKTTADFIALAILLFSILILFFFIINSDLRKIHLATKQLQKQASLIDTISDPIITTDSKLVITSWNKYAEELYGYSAAEAIGSKIGELLNIKVEEAIPGSSFAKLQQSGFYKDEYQCEKRGGETIFILGSVHTIYEKDASITGYLAVHKDITLRKQLEEKLKAINTGLEKQVDEKTTEIKTVFERLSDVFVGVDNNWNYTYSNKKAEEILSYPEDYFVGKNVWEEFPQYKNLGFHQIANEAIATQQYRFYEAYIGLLDHWFDIHIYPSVTGLTIYFKDITERKKAAEKIKQGEEKLQNKVAQIQLLAKFSKDVSRTETHEQIYQLALNNLLLTTRADGAAVLLFDEKAVMKFVHSTGLSEKYIKNVTDYSPWNVNEVNPYPKIVVSVKEDTSLHKLLPALNDEGIRALVFIPLIYQAKLLGKFMLFYKQSPISSEEEIQLAETIAIDTAFAIQEKKSSLDLISSRQKYKLLFDNNPMPMWMLSLPEKNFVDVNRSAVMQYGYSKKEFLQMNAAEIRPKEDVEKFISLKNKSHYEDNYRGIWRHLKKNGQVIQVEIIAHDIHYEGKEVRLILANNVDNKIKAEEKLRHSYKEIRQLAIHLQNIREEERTIIAREIHDELGQQLTGLKMYISWLQKKIQPTETDIKNKFTNTFELIEDTIASVRKISTDLRPSMLDDLGLIAAMEWQSNEFEKRSGITSEFINASNNCIIPANLTTGLFRIFQESLTNVARHAEAQKVTSVLRSQGNFLTLTIEDDGKGFTLLENKNKKTLGLFGMKERTMVMGGNYDIKSQPGYGTIVSVTVPLSIQD